MKTEFPNTEDKNLKCLFINSYYDQTSNEERRTFEDEMAKLNAILSQSKELSTENLQVHTLDTLLCH